MCIIYLLDRGICFIISAVFFLSRTIGIFRNSTVFNYISKSKTVFLNPLRAGWSLKIKSRTWRSCRTSLLRSLQWLYELYGDQFFFFLEFVSSRWNTIIRPPRGGRGFLIVTHLLIGPSDLILSNGDLLIAQNFSNNASIPENVISNKIVM